MLNLEKFTYKQMAELRVEITNAMAEVEKTAKQQLLEGKVVAGFALREGRKVRKVTNEDQFSIALGDHLEYGDIYAVKLNGLPALEKKLKATGMDSDQVAKVLEPHVLVTQAAPSLEYYGEE